MIVNNMFTIIKGAAAGVIEQAIKANRPYLVAVLIDREIHPVGTGTWQMLALPHPEPNFTRLVRGGQWLLRHSGQVRAANASRNPRIAVAGKAPARAGTLPEVFVTVKISGDDFCLVAKNPQVAVRLSRYLSPQPAGAQSQG